MDLIRNIHKKALFILLPLAAVSALADWKILPFSILFGGALGLLNLRGLAWGVRGLLGEPKANVKMLFFSQFRLVMVFVILALFLYLRLVNPFGILAGFTVVFILVIMEGLAHSKKETANRR